MTLLNTADRIYKGTAQAVIVAAGTNQVWPPLSSVYVVFDAASAISVIMTAGGVNVKNTSTGTNPSGAHVASAYERDTGKFYYEATLTTIATSGAIGLGGVGTSSSSFSNMQGSGTTGAMIMSSGNVLLNGTPFAALGTRASGNIIGIAVDLDNRKFWCRVAPSGNWDGNGTHNPATNVGGFALTTGAMVPFVTFGGSSSTGPGNLVKTNFGQRAFTGAVPAGFTSGWPV